MQHYDFIIAGGGLSGLSLACHLVRSPLRERRILIIDRNEKIRNDRTWSFWTDRPLLIDPAVYCSWDRLRIAGKDAERIYDLGRYRYKTIRGVDFFRFAQRELSSHGNVHFLRGVVGGIQDGPEGVCVTVDGLRFSATWLFDSLFNLAEFKTDAARYHYIKLGFEGWEVETRERAFTPRVATLLDFRTPQRGATRFFYVLPYSERRALVEYTLFCSALPKREAYGQAICAYVDSTLGINNYRVVRKETGVIPITDQPFPRRIGQRVMAIGLKGGRVKPSTGYAFTRVQQDCAAIVSSLMLRDHPFDVPSNARRYRAYDSLLLHIMGHRGDQVACIFGALFKRNPIQRTLRFLDEETSPWEDLLLIATLPPWLFLQALVQRKARRALTDPLLKSASTFRKELTT